MTLIADSLKVSPSTGYKMYHSESLDFRVLIRVCELYNLKITDFLGISAEELPKPLKVCSETNAEHTTLDELNEKVDLILEKLK